MISFVKPSARAKFGIAAASTAALMVSPLGVLPASASVLDVTNCNASGSNSLLGAVTAANSIPGDNFVNIVITSDCTVTLTNTIEITESIEIYNASGYDLTLTHDNTLTGPLMLIDEPDEVISGSTNVRITGLVFNGQDRATSYAQFEIAASEMQGNVYIRDSNFLRAEAGAVDINNADFNTNLYGTYFFDNVVADDGADGGAINTIGKLRIHDSHLRFNDADDNGGAIYALNTTVEIVRSQFDNNTAGSDGGAVYINTDVEPQLEIGEYYNYYSNLALTVNATLFEYNTADRGGALYFIADPFASTAPMAQLFNATFDSNSAAQGGAIFARYGEITIGGYGPYQGGTAIYPSKRSLFLNNSSSGVYGGGAIYNFYLDMAIGGTTFEGNTAVRGGALSQSFGTLSVGQSHFTGNSVTGTAGAIMANRVDSARIYLTSFVENSATDAAGAALLNVFGEATVYSNTFYNNEAGYSSQLFMYGSELTNDSLFSNNTLVDTLEENSTILAGIFNGDTYIGANIFASTYDRVVTSCYGIEAGANLSTSIFDAEPYCGPRSRDSTSGLQNVYSAQVSWADLDLQELAEYDTYLGPDVFSHVIPLGPDSVAIDIFNLGGDAENALGVSDYFTNAFYVDGRGAVRFSYETFEPTAGSGLDAGAFEYGAGRNDVGAEPTPTTPNISITGVSKPSISAGGDSFSVYGTGLDDVTELFVAGVKVGFRVVSATELAVTTGVLPVGAAEILAIATDGRASFQLGVAVTDTPSFWTKNLGNGQVKLYAKNVVGAGKVRFMHNGKEIAWINAVDETDPKLRKAAGSAYLVRTVNLVSGKNRLEITLDGVRVRYTTYTK